MENTVNSQSEKSSRLQVKEGDVISSPFTHYTVLEILGCGAYGQVVKCRNISTEDMVAVKMMLDAEAVDEAEQEVKMLQKVNSLNHPNILKFIEKFKHKDFLCMVFEVLHEDLFHTVIGKDYQAKLNEIRPIAKQLFSALDALTDIGILHTDIKADNVMLVGQSDLKVKLIDFGLAFHDGEAEAGTIMQPVPHRSPEILLGLPFSHGIDVWGTGLVLAFLYLHSSLFHSRSTYRIMKHIVQLLGQPEDHLLDAGKYTREFFTEVEATEGPGWRLKTPEEYARGAGEDPNEEIIDFNFKSLDDLVDVYDFESSAEHLDRLQFVDLLKSMLNVDGTKRISGFQASNHPFVTMSHLSDPLYEAYLMESKAKMSCSYQVDSADGQQDDEEREGNQQVWEEEETDDGDWEEPEPTVWEQPIDAKWEKPSDDDWEQCDDSAWEETGSAHLDLEKEGQVLVTETTQPSSEPDQTESPIMAEAVSGLSVVTCPPTEPTETTGSSSKKLAKTQKRSFSQKLSKFWKNFKASCIFCFIN